MEPHGKQFIGQTKSCEGKTFFQAENPATGETLPGNFLHATGAEIEQAVALADAACAVLRIQTPDQRAMFLDSIAEEIMSLGDDLIARCHQETALSEERLRGERARTCMQLRMFASLVREGSWVDARIETAIPDRTPVPKPDLRLMRRPLGPVAVFCASNFPLAFSVAGGDTASALAAGNPVLVKAHHAHPGTAELVGLAIRKAAAAAAMPEGVFALLHGPGREVGMALVRHPSVKAAGFTGSRKGGRALFDAAASRTEPIPVYAEMSSINPMFILPGALEDRSDAIAAGLRQSVTLGVGQFCTRPGIIVLLAGRDAETFLADAANRLAASSQDTMLTRDIFAAYAGGIGRLANSSGVALVGDAKMMPEMQGKRADPAMFRTSGQTFLADDELSNEVFGPMTLAVVCRDRAEMFCVARKFRGELTSTIHATTRDLDEYRDLLAVMEARVGRIVVNGFPTGVEVCSAMNHGGPYPATTDAHFTSVGTAAVLRFSRPICFQNVPDHCLPCELQDANPRNIWRLVDGRLTKEPLSVGEPVGCLHQV
jgi:2,5-dioxopentanoate dehydrogenase